MNNYEIEVSAGSRGIDQEQGRRRGDDQDQRRGVLEESYVSLDKVYSAVFFWCRALGLHVITRNKQGDYVVCGLSLAPAIVMSAFVLVSLGIEIRTLTTPLPFWFSVILFSNACGYGFCLYANTQACWNAGRMRSYMAGLSRVKVQKNTWGTWAVVGAFLYPLLASVGVYVLLPEWRWAPPSMFITCAVPALLDTYMTCFSRVLKEALKDLGREVRRRDSWRREDVSGFSRRWMTLTQLVQKHNEIFRPTLLLRLLALVIEAMACLLVFWATTYVFYLDQCVPVIAITVMPLLQMNLRFCLLCLSGEDFARTAEGVVVAVRAAAYTQPPASPQQLDLSAFAARLEAHPLHLHIWGMDSLSMNTYISILRVIVTYLLGLIQFCVCEKMNWVGGDQGGSFSRLNPCFPPNPDMNITTASTSPVVGPTASPPLPLQSALANLWKGRMPELEVE